VIWAGAQWLPLLGESDELRVGLAMTARFYGDGIAWAMSLPLPELMRWNRLMRQVHDAERGR
jgi:hypothetical protein